MVREFKLPDVGEGLTEAEVVSWLVEVGETVTEDQPVAEVETDKAVVEVPSPVNGTVRELRAEEGEMVKVGEVIITFDVEGEESEEAEESGGAEETEATGGEAAMESEAATETGAEQAVEDVEGAESAVEQVEESGEGTTPAGAETTDGASASGGRVFAAPSARRLGRELGVDIGTVDGSGPGGRVTEGDVRSAAEADEPAESEGEGKADEVVSATRRADESEGTATPSGAASAGARTTETADRNGTLAAPATRKLADERGVDLDSVPTDEERDGRAFVTPEQVSEYAEAQQAAQRADREALAGGGGQTTGASAAGRGAGGRGAGGTGTGGAVAAEEREEHEERIQYKGVRRTIGEQMARSAYTAPHVTHHDEVDVTRLVETRGRLKTEAEERGIALSYLPFVMKAVVAGLKQYPIINSSLDEETEEIVIKHYHNVGVATATDAGLMVPVVENVGAKDMLTVASETNELVAKARDRSIAREEMQGGTFTITNFGAIGGEYATPIINYPETAILGLGAIKEKPRVEDGEVVPRKVMTLSLSIDHRVIDGADAAQFVNTVKEYLEAPELLLLE